MLLEHVGPSTSLCLGNECTHLGVFPLNSELHLLLYPALWININKFVCSWNLFSLEAKVDLSQCCCHWITFLSWVVSFLSAFTVYILCVSVFIHNESSLSGIDYSSWLWFPIHLIGIWAHSARTWRPGSTEQIPCKAMKYSSHLPLAIFQSFLHW